VSASSEELEALLALMRTLRDPVRGCPWDRAQTFASIARYTIEEAYELADAIARGEMERLRDELGDLLFQVVFHARIAEEQQLFNFATVARSIHEKLVRRHPHVFGEQRALAPEELHASWEAHKARERHAAGERGVLANVPRALPALARAAKLGQRAARVGFDWQDAQQVRAKVTEELRELDEALAGGQRAEITEEMGDVLFALANWARHLQVEPESALRAATDKFEHRFERMEALAAARGLMLERLSAAQWDELWRLAKSGAQSWAQSPS
jgi:nucleoside triphosphate diphosphatase